MKNEAERTAILAAYSAMDRYEVIIHPWLDRWAVIDVSKPAPKRQRYPFASYAAAQAEATRRNG